MVLGLMVHSTARNQYDWEIIDNAFIKIFSGNLWNEIVLIKNLENALLIRDYP